MRTIVIGLHAMWRKFSELQSFVQLVSKWSIQIEKGYIVAVVGPVERLGINNQMNIPTQKLYTQLN